jgi:hypothetical protein
MESQVPADRAADHMPDLRASDRERDAALQTLQAAFAEGRLGDDEFDERMRSALAARTRTELEVLFKDLPADAHPEQAQITTPGPRAGRFQLAYKNSLRRGGRWRVPERYTSVIYKGGGLLDLRAAELDVPVTTIRAVAYKSTIEIIVPPGVRVEASGIGVSSEVHGDPNPRSPVIVVRGLAYKGSIDVRTTPPR